MINLRNSFEKEDRRFEEVRLLNEYNRHQCKVNELNQLRKLISLTKEINYFNFRFLLHFRSMLF